jgi:transposase
VLSLPSAIRIFLCTEPTDMRRGFDRLAEMVRSVIRQDPLSGHLFVFRSRAGNRLKLLYWDRDGLALWYKRLEKGRFPSPTRIGEDFRIDARDLAMMLEGLEEVSVRRRIRFELPRFDKLTAPGNAEGRA